MTKNNILKTYNEFSRFLQNAQSDDFYTFFKNEMNKSKTTITVFEKYTDKNIDLKWVKIMEDTIIPLDMIVRNPTRFIKREEDIVGIEQAKEIGPESIRYLSQHTGMISSVKDGEVTPKKILNITKEESIETYENRFIYTLLKLSSYFLEKRITDLVEKCGEDKFLYQLDGDADIGVDNLNFHLDVKLNIPMDDVSDDKLISIDVSTLSPTERVNRIYKIFQTFQGSSFYKRMSGCAPVRPPLVMTNVLKKNPNFMKTVTLWDFLNNYTEKGYTTEFIERYRTPSEDDKDEMFAVLMLQYVMMKKQSGKAYDTTDASDNTETEVEPDQNKVETHDTDDLPDDDTQGQNGGNIQTLNGDSSMNVMSNFTEEDLKKALKSSGVLSNAVDNKDKNDLSDKDGDNMTKNQRITKIIAPDLIRRSIDELCENFNLTIDEVHKIYQKEIRKKLNKQENEFAKARGIFNRAISFERENNRAKANARHTQILRELKKRFKTAKQQQNDIVKKKKLKALKG